MNIKIAVIGCGYWGQNHVRKFSELGVLAAISDANMEQAIKIASQYGDPKILTENEIEESTDIVGVVLATPAELHAKQAERFLRAGKHVFVEKPLALNIDDAIRLKQTAHETKKILMVGHVLQYHPAYIKLKKIIETGDLGNIQYIYSNRLSFGKIRTEENVLWSFAPHDISMILGLAQAPLKNVYATGSAVINHRLPDSVTTHLEFSNGLHAQVFVNWLNPFKEQKLVIIGSKASAVFDDCQNWDKKLIIYKNQVLFDNGTPVLNKDEGLSIPLIQAEPLKEECKHFIDCIQYNQEPKTNATEAIKVLEVLNEAQKSLDGQNSTESKLGTRDYYKHESAYVDEGVQIGKGTKIWHFSHILKGVQIGQNTNIGQNVMIGPDVKVGDNCKIQNNVSLYQGIVLENNVFCGPSCVFTNVFNPRAHIERKNEYRKTIVKQGASIGANATIVCGVILGEYCFVGAGATVTRDVKPHALVVGTPAKQIGWMSHAGEKLDNNLICPREGQKYTVVNDLLIEI